ncbi:hypothetical protein [Nitriliruptor alkaliphilus]|uniref:hypothetical protein n=1 Tax=Nitriliruptor alkaliphilus TaxID=427918 RepID=UPI0012ECEF94|nr:hypothetical protein [Nitriliruptor alkaliphilus]
MSLRIRAAVTAGLLAIATVATAGSAAADVCYSVSITLNGDAIVEESDCIAT